MSMSEEYQPINCDDYESLELACMHGLILTLELRGEAEKELKAKACDLFLRKQVEYLVIEHDGQKRELRLDHIISFSHPRVGTVIVSRS